MNINKLNNIYCINVYENINYASFNDNIININKLSNNCCPNGNGVQDNIIVITLHFINKYTAVAQWQSWSRTQPTRIRLPTVRIGAKPASFRYLLICNGTPWLKKPVMDRGLFVLTTSQP